MVRALLDDRKTQTRRLLLDADQIAKGPWTGPSRQLEDGAWQIRSQNYNAWRPVRVPYRVGDRLYVRERGAIAASKTAFQPFVGNEPSMDTKSPAWPRSPDGTPYKVCQAMHMPKWASRLTLVVTAVRVQRLQEISEEDAKAEGVGPKLFGAEHGKEYTRAYITLWNELNAKRAPWSSNPFVVAYTFTVHRQHIDQL